ncbi:MAG: hypothetical protein R3281_08995 [Balneolaceae bacterium]|nr:hypothetical protein [Balneolaceae bacterium]
MKVKTMVGALIFLIVLNIGLLGTIVYLHVTDRKPPIARFMDPKPKFEAPFTQPFDSVENLSAEQRKKLVQVLQSFRTEVEPQREQILRLEEKMFTVLIEQDSSSTDSIRNTMREIAEIRLQIGDQALESLQEAKKFLSERQQRIFIRRIMSAGRGPGPDGPTPLMRNQRPFDNR